MTDPIGFQPAPFVQNPVVNRYPAPAANAASYQNSPYEWDRYNPRPQPVYPPQYPVQPGQPVPTSQRTEIVGVDVATTTHYEIPPQSGYPAPYPPPMPPVPPMPPAPVYYPPQPPVYYPQPAPPVYRPRHRRPEPVYCPPNNGGCFPAPTVRVRRMGDGEALGGAIGLIVDLFGRN